jgi:iron complex outermembrane receptor protein
VEVIYGSNALQGIGGTGGIVNQVTVGAPQADGLGGRVLVQGTSGDGFESDGFGGKVAGLLQYKAGRFDATVGAAYDKRGVFYDGKGRRTGINLTQGETQDRARSRCSAGSATPVLDRPDRPDRQPLRTEGRWRLRGRAGQPRHRPADQRHARHAPGKPAANRTESVALSITDTALWGGNFVSQVFFNRSRDTFGEPTPQATFQDALIAPVGTLFDQSQNRSRKIGGKISYERPVPGFEALTAIVGFDALWDKTEQRLIATNRVWVPPTDFRSFAPFGQLNLKLLDGKLRLAGRPLRGCADHHRRFHHARHLQPHVREGGSPRFRCAVQRRRDHRTLARHPRLCELCRRLHRPRCRPGYPRHQQAGDRDRHLSQHQADRVQQPGDRDRGKRGPLDGSVTYFWSTSKEGQLLVQRPDGIFDVQRQRVEIQGWS